MRTLADWLFKIGYSESRYGPVKDDFLKWYQNAAEHHYVQEQLDSTEVDLRSLTIDAATDAEQYREESAIIELVDSFEEVRNKANALFHYLFLGASVLGASFVAGGLLALQDLVSQIVMFLGAALFGCGILGVSVYRVLRHQLYTNADLVEMFNEELTERPGNVRRYDRQPEHLAAQFFWNRSLCKPVVIDLLILLVVLRTVHGRIYNLIADDLENNITDFMDMDAVGILKTQLQRVRQNEPIDPK